MSEAESLPSYAAPLDKSAYIGREQTFVKHFFLRRYLQGLAFKLLQAQPNRPFLYIDAFSGPWRSESERREDTSFSIALNVLSGVVQSLVGRGLAPQVRAVFVERDKRACAELEGAVAGFPLVSATVLNGTFESRLGDITSTVGNAFAFTFVDPTGWSGMPLPAVSALLRGRQREVLVNLMAYAIERHIGDAREPVRGSFNALFGDERWWDEYVALRSETGSREAAFRALYLRRLQAACGYKYATTTRVRWPGKDRTYFYLAYGTHSPVGIDVFRQTEKACVAEQEEVARDALDRKAAASSRMGDLFAGLPSGNDVAFRDDRRAALASLRTEFAAWLSSGTPRRQDDLLASLLQRPLLQKADCVELLRRAERDGRLSMVAEGGRSDPLVRPAVPNPKAGTPFRDP